MKFTINKQSLLRELSYLCQHVIDKKCLIPALSHVQIEADSKGAIRLTGTDLDQTLACETEGIVQKQGACALPARKLFEIVKNLPDSEIVIETKSGKHRAEIKCERSHFKLAGINVKDMPELHKFKETSVALPSEVLRTMIERTRFAISQEESRYTLSGAKFILRKKGVRMVSTDGSRLSLIDNKSITSKKEFDCLIPKKALVAVSNLAASHEGEVGMSLDDNHIYFEVGARTLISRLLVGEFPNYEMILPKSNEHKVKFECDELLQAIRRVAVMASTSRAICLEFSKKKLRIFTQEESEGAAEETLSIEGYSGAQMVIGFNSGFLIEYLSILGEGLVNIEFNSPNQVVQLTPVGDAGFNSFNIVMPMRINDSAMAQSSDSDAQQKEADASRDVEEPLEIEENENDSQILQEPETPEENEVEEEDFALPEAA